MSTGVFRVVNGVREELTPEELIEWQADCAARDAQMCECRVRDARADAYPAVKEQLDMLWHELDTAGTISKSGTWFLTIKSVKDAHPKE